MKCQSIIGHLETNAWNAYFNNWQLVTTGDVTISLQFNIICYGLKTKHEMLAKSLEALSASLEYILYWSDCHLRCSANRSVSNSIIIALVCYPVGMVQVFVTLYAFALTHSVHLVSVSLLFLTFLAGHPLEQWLYYHVHLKDNNFSSAFVSLSLSLSLLQSVYVVATYIAKTFITHSVDRLSAT